MNETLGNPNLQIEYLASRILGQQVLPVNFVNTLISFSKLPIVSYRDIQEELDYIYKLRDKDGLVKESEVIKFLRGENSDLFNALSNCVMEMHEAIPNLAIADNMIQENNFNQLDARMQNTTNLNQISDILSNANPIPEDSIKIEKSITDFHTFVNLGSNILNTYNTLATRIPTKIKEESSPSKVKYFLINLYDSLKNSNQNMLVIAQLSKLIDVLNIHMPEMANALDPFLVDSFNEFYHTLLYPTKFFSLCKNSEIINPEIGSVFSFACPAFYTDAMDMMTEEYHRMPEEEKRVMRSGMGMPADESQLVSLCSQYVNKVYTQQQ